MGDLFDDFGLWASRQRQPVILARCALSAEPQPTVAMCTLGLACLQPGRLSNAYQARPTAAPVRETSARGSAPQRRLQEIGGIEPLVFGQYGELSGRLSEVTDTSPLSQANLFPIVLGDLRFIDKGGAEIKADRDGVFRRWRLVDHIRCRYPPSKAGGVG